MAIYKNIVCTDTAELCTLGSRTFTKDVSGFAICGYYYLTSGYTGPIVVSPTQSVAHYQPGNIGSNDYIEVNGVKWYYTVDGYFQSGNRDASSGNYTLKLGSFSNARDCATYLVNLYYDLISTSVKPTGTGNVSVSYNNENAIVLANANGGYTFDYWELDGYTRLEYIENTAKSYINTGMYADNTCKFESKFKFTSTSSNQQTGQFTGANILWGINGQGQFLCYANGDKTYGSADTDWHTFTIDLTNSTGSVDDNTQSLTGFSGTSGYPFYLFSRRDNSGTYTTYNCKGQLAYHKVYKHNVLVQHLIPVIRHSDGAFGLLDLIEMKFYGNNGTGKFIGGGIYAS